MAAIGRARPAQGADLERVAAELVDVLARPERSQPLVQCYDDDFFQERWIALGVRDALQGGPGNMDDIVDAWLRSLDLGTEHMFGEASLFLLLCAMRDHLERRSGAQDWLRAALARRAPSTPGCGGEAAIELTAAYAGDEYDDEDAGLRVVEWAGIVELQPCAMDRPDGAASLWPIFVGLASRSGVAGVQTLRNLLRLVAPPDDAAPAQLLLWFGIALVARRHGPDEVWQPRLVDTHARLAGHLPESWHRHLGGWSRTMRRAMASCSSHASSARSDVCPAITSESTSRLSLSKMVRMRSMPRTSGRGRRTPLACPAAPGG